MVKKFASMKNIGLISDLYDQASASPTLRDLASRLDGCDKNEAYKILKNLSDRELKVLAVLVENINTKFNRTKSEKEVS